MGAFMDGFRAMLPLWVGAVPSGLAFGAAARDAGLTLGQAQLMSLLVFSAPAQMAALSTAAAASGLGLILAVALAANAHTMLIGIACGRQLRPRPAAAAVAGFLLTEGAYAVASAQPRFTLHGLMGAGLSMYLAWNAGTAISAVFDESVWSTADLGVDFVVTLTFVAVLVRWLRGGMVVAGTAAGAAVVLANVLPSGIAVLSAAALGTLVGAFRSRGRRVAA